MLTSNSRVDSSPPWTYKEMCGLSDSKNANNKSIYDVAFPGNFSSDAQFFVFTGVIAWLYCFFRFNAITYISLKKYCYHENV